MEMAQLAKLHAKAARFYKHRYYLLMLPSIILSITISTLVGLLPDSGVANWYRQIIVSVFSAINALLAALLAFLKYAQRLDAHDQARIRFSQLDQSQRFMIHSQHFAYMPVEEVIKQFHATKTAMTEASRARPASSSIRWRRPHRRHKAACREKTVSLHGLLAGACPYAFPNFIQKEADRFSDEQMGKLNALASRDSFLDDSA